MQDAVLVGNDVLVMQSHEAGVVEASLNLPDGTVGGNIGRIVFRHVAIDVLEPRVTHMLVVVGRELVGRVGVPVDLLFD